MDTGKSANYWPGFVDALTNVVIAMVFVIVVLAIALSFAAQLMGKRVADEAIKRHVAAAAAAAAAASAAAATPAPTAPLEAPPSQLPKPTRIAVRGNEQAASSAGGTLRQSANALQFDFAPAALTLDATAITRLKDALAARKDAAARAKVQIVASGPDMQLSENQRSAYVRVMSVRNELLDQGFAAERIAVRIDTQRNAPAAQVTVSITGP